MKLLELIRNAGVIECAADKNTEIVNISSFSGEIKQNWLFVAARGRDNDGNNYIHDALAAGAAAIITDVKPQGHIPYVLVKDARAAFGIVAGNFYGNNHRNMTVIAVIGTNGKTTTCHMIGNCLAAAGRKTTIIGTLGAYIDGKREDCDLTTPDPMTLHRIIKQSADAGVKYIVYEVSAHAIYWKKTEGIAADIAIFTNFSQDHLDFFGTMEEYAAVKKSYFTPDKVCFGIINGDDAVGKELIDKKAVYLASYAIHGPADAFAMDIEYGQTCTSCLINCCDDIFELRSNFLGEFNLYNTLAAICCLRSLSVDIDTIKKCFSTMEPVAGRFNIMESTKRVVVDFAHTPDGLSNLLKVARKICMGKLYVVFGCGGNRDPKKRAIMGRIAAELADFTVITSDNSRDEDPNLIIDQIEQGHREVSLNYIKIPERENAVTYALLLAKADDLVVIAGKGAEEYMEEKGIKRPYSDKKVVEEIFRRYKI